MKFTFATFCFGERYYNQVNRFIGDILESDYKTNLVVVTDEPSKINNQEFVHIFHINDFNPNYLEYAKNYYDFDFSVKRYSLKAALSIGFTKMILVDCDMRVNASFFYEEKILGAFDENSLSGPVTYNFHEQVHTNSELGRRLLEYEKYFNHDVDKDMCDAFSQNFKNYDVVCDSSCFIVLYLENECLVRLYNELNTSDAEGVALDWGCWPLYL